MRYAFYLCLGVVVCLAGCGGASRGPMAVGEKKTTEERKADLNAGNDAFKKAPPQGNNPPQEKDAPVKRKIKYTADLRLITDDFAAAEIKLRELLDASKGYLASSDVSGSPGSPRQGTWRLRVPVENFHTFCDQVAKIAEVERNSINSEDVTMEYYDLESYIKTRQAEMEGLRELLQKAASEKLENLLAVRKEMGDVQADLNRQMGRLKMLANLTDLTTVTVTIRERQKYDPEKRPELMEKPTFWTRASKTFGDSLDTLLEFGQGVTLLAIAVAPWSPFLLAFGLAVWIAIRRATKPVRVIAKPAARQDTPPLMPPGESPG